MRNWGMFCFSATLSHSTKRRFIRLPSFGGGRGVAHAVRSLSRPRMAWTSSGCPIRYIRSRPRATRFFFENFSLGQFQVPNWSPVTHGIALTVTLDSERRADCDVPTPSLLPISPACTTSLWIEGCVAAGWTRDGVNGARYTMYMICDVVRPPTGFILQSH